MTHRIATICALGIFLIVQTMTQPSRAEFTSFAEADACPYGRIESSDTCCRPHCTFKGSVIGWDPAIKPIVKWTVSAGRIISGQSGWLLKVDTCKVSDRPITVTLNVTSKNLPRACEIKETYTVKPCGSS